MNLTIDQINSFNVQFKLIFFYLILTIIFYQLKLSFFRQDFSLLKIRSSNLKKFLNNKSNLNFKIQERK
jgi:hypothetical protein